MVSRRRHGGKQNRTGYFGEASLSHGERGKVGIGQGLRSQDAAEVGWMPAVAALRGQTTHGHAKTTETAVQLGMFDVTPGGHFPELGAEPSARQPGKQTIKGPRRNDDMANRQECGLVSWRAVGVHRSQDRQQNGAPVTSRTVLGCEWRAAS